MRWTSYAQNGEDVVLARVLADVDAGFWIDVGAQDPRMDSVTCAFAERGWHGINIEPVPHWHAALSAARPRDLNLAVAAGEAEARLPFFEVEDSGLSTLDAVLASAHRAAGHAVREGEIAVRTLASICAQHVRGPVHFLKIDAEGAEGAVLRGMDLDAVRPWVVLVEATAPNSRVPTHAEWEPVLLAGGYAFAYGDGINRFYLAQEHASLADRFGPPTVLDDVVRREQVDAVAALDARLAEVEALSRQRAEELESHAARIGEKDVALAEWQARWQAEAEGAAGARAGLADAQLRTREAQAAHDVLAGNAAATASELDRMHREAAALQAALVAADANAAELDRMHREAEALRAALATADANAIELDRMHREAEALRAALATADANAIELDRMHREAEALQAALAATDAHVAALETARAAADANANAMHSAAALANARAETAEAAVAASDARAAALAARLDASDIELAALRDNIAAAAARDIEAQAQLVELRASVAAGAVREADAQAQVDRLRGDLAAAEAREADTRARLDATHARLASVERALDGLATQVPDLQAQLRAATAAHVVAHAELLRHVGLIDGMRADYAAVLASRSWRLTAPLRQANELLSRLRGTGVRGPSVDGHLASGGPAAPPLPLSEDAERVLASAPVVGGARN
jgi:FkbM family methyltransferase